VKFRTTCIGLILGLAACAALSLAAQKKGAAGSGVLARIYDWSKGGEQTFPVLIPQELTPGSVKVLSAGSATADGKTYESLKVTSSDLEILLLLDSTHRLIRLEVPDAKVSVIRE